MSSITYTQHISKFVAHSVTACIKMFYGVMFRYLKAEEFPTAHVVVDGSTKDVQRVIHHDTRVEQST